MLFLSHLWMLCLFLNENIKKTKTQNSPNLNIVICCWCTYLNIAQYSFESIISANKHPICQEGGSNLGITRCKDCQAPSMGQDNVPEVLPKILHYCNIKCFVFMNPKLWTSYRLLKELLIREVNSIYFTFCIWIVDITRTVSASEAM